MESTHPQGKCKFSMLRIPYLDSHTGGEPTRLVEAGAPDLGSGTVAEQLSRFRNEHDTFRSQVLNEPRGSDVMVGALLVKPADPTCQFGVIYFNNVGYLGMCGHGTIGLVASLSYQGRLQPGTCRIETPVGVVEATLHPGEPAGHMDGAYPNRVSVRNIPASRHLAHVPVEIDGRTIHGDVAWGGNWFFLVHDHGLDISLKNLDVLTDFSCLSDKVISQFLKLVLQSLGFILRNQFILFFLFNFLDGVPSQVPNRYLSFLDTAADDFN